MSIILSPEFIQIIEAEIHTSIPFNLNMLITIIWALLLLIGITGIIDIIGGALLLQEKKSGKIWVYTGTFGPRKQFTSPNFYY